jgi:hypothetical protein
MNRQNADFPVMEGQQGLSSVPTAGAMSLAADEVIDESDLDELVYYQPVPLRSRGTVPVQYRPGGRLKPLPYPLDEDDS